MVDEIDRARSAMRYVDPNCPRDEWVEAAMAMKAAGVTLEEFIKWSSTADNFGGEGDCCSLWRSINSHGRIGPATLFALAKAGGWPDGTSCHDRARQRLQEPPKARPRGSGNAFDIAAVVENSEAATATHGYIQAKLGLPEGLHVVATDSKLRLASRSLAGWLVVPIREGDSLTSAQFISPVGDKLTAPGSMGRGWFTVGSIESGSTVYVCEGLGAAWSCHQATQRPAVVAFGLGRLHNVATGVTELGVEVVLVGDVGTEKKVERIAREIGCRWVVPPHDLGRNGDVNDLHQRDGMDAVANLLERALESDDDKRLRPIDFSDLDTNPPPPRRWGWQNWIPARSVTLLTGVGGVGKTLLGQQIANAFNVGCTLFGSEVTRGPVCGIFCEDDEDELRRRQVQVLHWMGRSAAYSSQHLHLVPRVGYDNALVAFGPDRRMRRTELLTQVVRLAKLTRAALVIIDNIAQVFAGNENDRHEVSAFCGGLAEICTETGAAVLLIGHPAKTAGSEFSGSTAWEAAVRSRLFLDRRADGLLELRRAKANYASTGDTVVLAYDDGVLRQVDPAESTGISAELAQNAVLAALDTYTRRQVATSHCPSARTNLIKLARNEGLLDGVTKDVGMRALNALIDCGEVLTNQPLPWKKGDRHKASGLARAVR